MFGKTTVDSVLNTLNKAITDLERVADVQNTEAAKALAEEVEAEKRRLAATDESKRATRVRNKLVDLVS